MNKTRLKKYANLIARAGVNVQKGQEVVVYAELDQPEFVKMVVDECYKAGAKKVSVEWNYQPLTKSHVRYCSEKVLGTLEDWQIQKLERQVETNPCRIFLISEDPDGLDGMNMKKYSSALAKKSKIIKPIRAKIENKYQWCIAGVPGKEWAKKVFPNERASTAQEKLWEAILDTSRVNDDPIKAWEDHNADLQKRCDYINSLELRRLIYKSESGTDFKINLIPDVLFCGGGERALGSNIYYNPNIPTEEIFTSPDKDSAEGIVYSSRPLAYNGSLIDEFWFRFEKGRVVDCGAKKGEEVIKEMIAMDENACRLGECALVPYTSPIRESEILFYNTLFDENAACHLALGRGFTNLVKGYENLTEDECHAKGINDSIIHVDFMIGTKDMDITGVTKDGKEVPLFRKGEWAF